MGRALFAITLVIGLLSAAIFRPSPDKALAASPGDVIINELMYNPSTGNQNDEFLELYNTTGSSIDLGGWSFSAGITLTFDPGVIIASNDYLVISPDIPQTLTTYGVVSSASYAGTNLSNGGETVTLVDDSLTEIDSIAYDDASPWPLSPDGTGPSLELKSTGLDNSIASNWGASTSSGGTSLAQNSLVGLSLPVIANVTDPNNVTDIQDIDITAEVTGTAISNVELKYKINFDADVTLTMYDDGAHNDGAAADNVYGAQIPAQAETTLIRFKVEATNGSGVKSSPSIDDSMDYHGYYIEDPSVTSVAPILEWFMEDVDYDDMHLNHVNDNFYLPAVIVYDDVVYDNSRIRIRGENRDYDKQSLKVKLPSGYEFDIAGGSNIPTDEFELLNNLESDISIMPTMTWFTEQTGLPTFDRIITHVQKNGEFQGVYVYANKYQKQWRDAYGYDGELYEDTQDVVNGAPDLTRLNSFNSQINDDSDKLSSSYTDLVLDSYDVPKAFNYMAAIGLVSGYDHFGLSNTLQYFDKNTDRWSNLLWDQAVIFGNNPGISPYDGRSRGLKNCPTNCAVYDLEVLRPLYLRRFRTLVDKLYTNDALIDKFDEYNSLYADEYDADLLKWPDQRVDLDNADIHAGYERHKELFLSYMNGFSWGLPDAQTQQERESVTIDNVVADADNTQEYIRLANSADTPVDVSDWQIDGIDYTIPAGSVVPANGVIYILRDDKGYKASHAAVLVAGQYSNDLGSSGTLTLKTEDNVTIDDYAY